MPSLHNNPLAHCVLISLIAHAALLLNVSLPMRPRAGEGVKEGAIKAQLVLSAATAERTDKTNKASSTTFSEPTKLTQSAAAKPTQHVNPIKQPAKEPAPKSKPRLTELSATQSALPTPVAAASTPASEDSKGAGEATASAANTVGARATSSGSDVGSNTASAGVPAGSLGNYRWSLANAMRRFKQYPALARERGWEGKTELLLEFSSHAPVQVSIARSSGRPLLDNQATETLRRAISSTALPGELQGRNFHLRMTMEFLLEED